jgi:hypothetical protein
VPFQAPLVPVSLIATGTRFAGQTIFGGDIADTCVFASRDEANEIFGLPMRHWNDIAGKLFKEEVYLPLLLEDKDGKLPGTIDETV